LLTKMCVCVCGGERMSHGSSLRKNESICLHGDEECFGRLPAQILNLAHVMYSGK
jgi:hypothetical protein